MIRFYYHPTPNPAKVALFLEETGLPYEIAPVDTAKSQQHTAEFRAINPNGKVPAIVDTDGPGGGESRVFDSTAILLYLGEKTGKLMGAPADRGELLSWLFFIATGLGPFSGQAVHFQRAAPEKLPYAINRYRRRPSAITRYSTRTLRAASSSSAKSIRSQTYPAGAGLTARVSCCPAATTRSPPIPISAAGSMP
jgi:glutathione S-transferase